MSVISGCFEKVISFFERNKQVGIWLHCVILHANLIWSSVVCYKSVLFIYHIPATFMVSDTLSHTRKHGVLTACCDFVIVRHLMQIYYCRLFWMFSYTAFTAKLLIRKRCKICLFRPTVNICQVFVYVCTRMWNGVNYTLFSAVPNV